MPARTSASRSFSFRRVWCAKSANIVCRFLEDSRSLSDIPASMLSASVMGGVAGSNSWDTRTGTTFLDGVPVNTTLGTSVRSSAARQLVVCSRCCTCAACSATRRLRSSITPRRAPVSLRRRSCLLVSRRAWPSCSAAPPAPVSGSKKPMRVSTSLLLARCDSSGAGPAPPAPSSSSLSTAA
ncbi:hypothetical protein I4F81_001278 [Pyropia yezoensis]|uniref:Uncharacterized protein n=1 Tax=Pyropia yezoensis TaxID=2788 RepID=A0ACC3BL91_PYRYE|nr:hypothetical protein I4F81_001278 [Neopyropia yezoensis]